MAHDCAAITDSLASDDVPGLHVLRLSHNNLGPYAQISAYGFNKGGTKELIRFNIEFVKAIITQAKNENYESAHNGICGINEGNIAKSKETDDEFSVDEGGTEGTFCSVTHGGRDRVRVYYSIA